MDLRFMGIYLNGEFDDLDFCTPLCRKEISCCTEIIIENVEEEAGFIGYIYVRKTFS